jgi:integrase
LERAVPEAECQHVEVVGSDGTSCGAADYLIAAGNCDTKDLMLAADGTVIQQLPDAMESKDLVLVESHLQRAQPKALRLDNPVAGLDRADRDSIGPAWDPKATPWLRPEQVRAVYLAMPGLALDAPWRAMFAVGTFAGLRTGEVIALEWADLDFQGRTIHVRRSVEGPLKDDESRIAPTAETLATVLTDWRKLALVGAPQVFKPTGHGGKRRADGLAYVKQHSLSRRCARRSRP